MAYSNDEQVVISILRNHNGSYVSPTQIGLLAGNKSCAWASSICIDLATRRAILRNANGHYAHRNIKTAKPRPFINTFIATLHGDKVAFKSEFHPQLSKANHSLSGVWDGESEQWWFDARDLDRAREVYTTIFGDPDEPRVTLRVCLDNFCALEGGSPHSIYVAGRQVASLRIADGSPKLGHRVILVSGQFTSGGTSHAREILSSPSATVLIRDVPCSKARELVNAFSQHASIEVGDDPVSAPEFTPLDVPETVASVPLDSADLVQTLHNFRATMLSMCTEIDKIIDQIKR